MIMQEWNNLGLSLCPVPQSPIVCIVVYFRVVEDCPKKSKFRSSGVKRYKAEKKSTTRIGEYDFNLQTRELQYTGRVLIPISE